MEEMVFNLADTHFFFNDIEVSLILTIKYMYLIIIDLGL